MDNSIEAAVFSFNEYFLKACAGSDITGNVSGTLSRFLATTGLPLYYKMKTHIALSGADEQNELHENLAACRHHLKAAERALIECKSVYKDAEDVRVLKRYEGIIEDEWVELRKREGDEDSD